MWIWSWYIYFKDLIWRYEYHRMIYNYWTRINKTKKSRKMVRMEWVMAKAIDKIEINFLSCFSELLKLTQLEPSYMCMSIVVITLAVWNCVINANFRSDLKIVLLFIFFEASARIQHRSICTMHIWWNLRHTRERPKTTTTKNPCVQMLVQNKFCDTCLTFTEPKSW